MGNKVRFKFVETIPNNLEDGIVYITTHYNTAIHKCMCGCGNEVVTPLSPNDWKLIYDGETVSLYPSIGNWSFDCQSHYWIRENKVIWAEKWSKDRIKENREADIINRKYGNSIKKKTSFWEKLFSFF